MGEYVVKLPDVGEGVAEAEVVEWPVAVGAVVREDEVIAVIMTDKANVEIPSPADGTVLWLAGEIGDTLAVGAPLVRLEVHGEGNVAQDLPAPQPRPAAADARRAATPPTPPTCSRAAPIAGPSAGPSAAAAAGAARTAGRSSRRAAIRTSRSPRRRCVAAPKRPASTCARCAAAVRPRASRMTISMRFMRAARRAGRPPRRARDTRVDGNQGGRPAAQDCRAHGLGDQPHRAHHLRRRNRHDRS